MIQKLKNKFLSDTHFIELIKGSATSFIFKIIGMGIGYLFTLLIARWYGADTMGLYALSITMLNIFVTISVFGFDNALVKFVAQYNTQQKLNHIKDVYLKAIYITTAMSMILSYLLFMSAEYIAIHIFNNINLTIYFQIVSLVIVPFSLLKVNNAFLRGLKKIKEFSFFESISIFLVAVILLILSYHFFSAKDEGTLISQALAIVISFLLSCFVIRKHITQEKVYKQLVSYKVILKVAFPMLLTSSMSLIMVWTDILMLGIFAEEEIVGVYSVVVKLASITSISLLAINSITAPKFSEFHSNKDIKGLKKIAQQSTKMIFYTSLPIILILLIFSEFILSMFGNEFIVGTSALLILMIGQLINAMTGSVGNILLMTGKEKLFQNIIIFTSILNIILNYSLVNIYGLNGVAMATAISLALLNIIPYFYVRYFYGFYTFSLNIFKIGERLR